MGIHHRHRRRQLVGRLVMIDDTRSRPKAFAAATFAALEMPQSTVTTSLAPRS
jgi:hypothetical protein